MVDMDLFYTYIVFLMKRALNIFVFYLRMITRKFSSELFHEENLWRPELKALE